MYFDIFTTNHYCSLYKPLRFAFPINGDCLNQFDGVEKDGKLIVKALVAAAPTADIYMNEEKAFLTEHTLKRN